MFTGRVAAAGFMLVVATTRRLVPPWVAVATWLVAFVTMARRPFFYQVAALSMWAATVALTATRARGNPVP